MRVQDGQFMGTCIPFIIEECAFKIHKLIHSTPRPLPLGSLLFYSSINHLALSPAPAVLLFPLHLRGRETFPELRDISSASLLEPIDRKRFPGTSTPTLWH